MYKFTDDNFEQISYKKYGLGYNCSYEFPFLHTHTHWEFMFVILPFEHLLNGEKIIAQPNTVYIIKPHDTHALFAINKNKKSKEDFTHLNIKITADALKKLLSEFDEDLYDNLLDYSAPLRFNAKSEIAEAFKALIKTLLISGEKDEQSVCTLLKFAIIDIIKLFYPEHKSQSAPLKTYYPEQIENLINKMQSVKYVSCSIKDIIGDTDYSHSQVLRIFKNTIGKTIREFFCEIKMRYACNLLANTDMPIIAVSNAIGYDSPSNFNRAFKKQFGATPKNYRDKFISKKGHTRQQAKK